ncbi:MAG: hypothetical protein H5T92_01225 [Synergistales bacterium]|nr:hypothetical protein [Synergistales bacterium]
MVVPLPLWGPPRAVADRILVVREAAGQVKTTTGGGVYYGLLGGRHCSGCVDPRSGGGQPVC